MDFEEALKLHSNLVDRKAILHAVRDMLTPFLAVEDNEPENMIWLAEEKGTVRQESLVEFDRELVSEIEQVEADLSILFTVEVDNERPTNQLPRPSGQRDGAAPGELEPDPSEPV